MYVVFLTFVTVDVHHKAKHCGVFSAGSLGLLLLTARVNTAASGPSWLYPSKHSPAGVHFHRDSMKESTGFPPAATLTSFSLIRPLTLPFFLLPLWSSSVPLAMWDCKRLIISAHLLTKRFSFLPSSGRCLPCSGGGEQRGVFLVLSLPAVPVSDTISHL